MPRFVQGIGDDCSITGVGQTKIVVTTDPVPVPAAKLLGRDPDLYWMGRLLVTINASDLAAAGASPLSLLVAIDAPSNLEVAEFSRFLEGISEGCRDEGLIYSGGNLREGKTLTAVGAAVGFSTSEPARRRGARPGDLLVSVGQGGIFWRDALAYWRGGEVAQKDRSPLFQPRSQIRPMASLVAESLIRASIDNSDGLLPSLEILAEVNDLSVVLDLEALRIPENQSGTEAARLWLGWGDWNILAAVSNEDLERASKVANENQSVILPLGVFGEGPAKVLVKRGDRIVDAPRLESERFSSDSWFVAGIEAYITRLLELELP